MGLATERAPSDHPFRHHQDWTPIVQQVVNAIVLGSVYCLFALGLSLSWGTLNVLNLAHGAVFMFSAFTCYLITQQVGWDLPVWLLVLIAMVVGASFEVALDVLVFRPIRKRSKTVSEAELSMLIASIGVAAIPVTIAQRITTDSPFTVSAKPIKASVYHLTPGVYVTNIEIAIVVVALGLTLALALWIQESRTGRALRALAYDAPTSGLMGISQSRMSALALGLSGASAGAAGVFLALFLDSLTPESGGDLLLKAFAAVVLGGVGSMWGAPVGAFVLAAGEVLVAANTSGIWTDAVSFGLIIVVLMLMPNGLFRQVKVDRI
jgi:branched-chain amino acid transport system permease protein